MHPPPSKIPVLIVDDIATTRENLAKLLFLARDIEVVGFAASGQEAVAQAAQLEPAVVLLDLTLPDVDGLEVVEALSRRLPRTRIVLMSNEGSAHYLAQLLPSAVRAILVKPITAEALLKALRHANQL